MFFFAHISLRILGQALTVTSPREVFLSVSINVRDSPIPPPTLNGSPLRTILGRDTRENELASSTCCCISRA